MPTPITLETARAAVAKLKVGDTLTLNAEPFLVMSRDCGSTEFCRPQYKDITGSYFRWSDENVAIALSQEAP